MSKELTVVEQAHGNLLNLRDNAFFEKLNQQFGVAPLNDNERFSLIKMADDLYAAEEAGVLQQENRFTFAAKQASDSYGSLGVDDQDAAIRKVASHLTNDPVLNESAAIFFQAIQSE